jgi:hypothetical protein
MAALVGSHECASFCGENHVVIFGKRKGLAKICKKLNNDRLKKRAPTERVSEHLGGLWALRE